MRVLAVDLSLTGTAWCNPDGIAGRIATKPEHGSTVDRAEIITDCLLDVAASHTVDLVVMEGLSFHSKGSATADLAKLHAVVEVRLGDGRWPFAFVAPSSIKVYAVGKGNAAKSEVLTSAVRRLGYGGSDDNEADVVWLHALCMDAFGTPTVSVPQTHRRALEPVKKVLEDAGVSLPDAA